MVILYFLAICLSASGYDVCSISMTKLTALPAFPHPKHLKMPLAGETENEGVFSSWNGQLPHRLAPRRLRLT